jgi:TraB/PrgY/gumN family
MQIIESSSWWVRSARITLTSSDGRKSVTLFPMVHVGEPGFYDRVYRDAMTHDAVLFEGLKSPITTRITRSYRWLASSKRLQLVVQPKLTHVEGGARVIHADLSHDEFVVHWRKAPLWLRLFLQIGAPVYGLRQRWFATRASLAKSMSLDDLKSRDEALSWSEDTAFLTEAILNARDERLVEKLTEALADPLLHRVAVVYGAAHMRAVLSQLLKKDGYRVGDMDWMTIISL